MLTSFRGLRATSMSATLAAAGLIALTPVAAQDSAAGDAETPDVTVSGSLAVVSDYRFRGVSLTAGDPAVQAGVTVTHKSGFYVGAWGSNIDDGGTDFYGDVELDLLAGWSGGLSEAATLDAGVLYYAYPTNATGNKAEFFEPYATLGTTLGPVSAKFGVNYAPSQDATGNEDNVYLHTELGLGIPSTPLTLNGHLGYNSGSLSADYVTGASTDKTSLDWSVGVSATFLGKLTAAVSYIGVEAPGIKALGAGKDFVDDTVVGSLTFAF